MLPYSSIVYIILLSSFIRTILASTLSIADQSTTIELLTDKSFDKFIKNGRYNPWLVLFTVPKCGSCKQTLEAFTNFNWDYEDESKGSQFRHMNISFGKVDCFSSSWTAMRFNIRSLPQLILIENNTYHLYMPKNITMEGIEEFLLSPGKSIPLPHSLGFIDIGIKFFDTLTETMKSVGNAYGFEWNNIMTVVLLVIIVGLFIVFEYYLINNCCRKKPQEKINHHHHNHTHSHQN